MLKVFIEMASGVNSSVLKCVLAAWPLKIGSDAVRAAPEWFSLVFSQSGLTFRKMDRSFLAQFDSTSCLRGAHGPVMGLLADSDINYAWAHSIPPSTWNQWWTWVRDTFLFAEYFCYLICPFSYFNNIVLQTERDSYLFCIGLVMSIKYIDILKLIT